MTIPEGQRDTDALIRGMLLEYGALTRGRLLGLLPDWEPRRYLYDLVAEYPGRGGGMLRPALLLANARALGGGLEEALGSAVSLELVHNALLVHDDVADESRMRRGEETLHLLSDVPLAINAGDALTLLSLKPLIANRLRLGPLLALRLIEEMEQTTRQYAEGWSIELGWRRENRLEITEAEYLRMVLKRSCWLSTIAPCRAGALIALGGGDLDRFLRFGFFLGVSYQIRGEVLGLTADSEISGREVAGDLWAGRRTLPLLRLLQVASTRERDRLSRIFAQPRDGRKARDIAWVRRLLDGHGAIDYAREMALGFSDAAEREAFRLYGKLPESRDRSFLLGLAGWLSASL